MSGRGELGRARDAVLADTASVGEPAACAPAVGGGVPGASIVAPRRGDDCTGVEVEELAAGDSGGVGDSIELDLSIRWMDDSNDEISSESESIRWNRANT